MHVMLFVIKLLLYMREQYNQLTMFGPLRDGIAGQEKVKQVSLSW
jgi:hypothetical protein